jgi:hypothetical protein
VVLPKGFKLCPFPFQKIKLKLGNGYFAEFVARLFRQADLPSFT